MRVSRRGSAAVAVGAALALVAAGCSSDGDGTTASTDGEITITGNQPENPLVPSNTTETQGGQVVDALFTGLINYNPDDAHPENAVAEKFETTDNLTYTVTLKKGWKFHDGTDVDANSFVDAWNWAAYSPNGAQNSSFFGSIKGFEDVQSEDPDEDGPKQAPKPKTDKMSGLEVVDANTFKVTLSGPSSVFNQMVGYSAFMPLPKAFFKDPVAFGKKPIGNGPFKFISWKDNDSIVVERYDDYKGDDKPKVKKVTFKHYTTSEASYADLISGNIDYEQQIPTNALVGDKYKTDLPDRWIEKPVGVVTYVAFPIYDKRFTNKKLRQAISMAVDRKTITDKIFNKTRQPATGYISPSVEGARENVCKYCEYNPTEAKKLLAEAGGWQGEMKIFYNGDASHKDWVEAMANSISKALGIKAVASPVPTFAEFRSQINAHKMTGPYRAGWQMDYPHIENFLNPLYKTGASSNDGLYSSPEVDAALKQADEEKDAKKAIELYQKAEDLVAEDVPSIAMWMTKAQVGYSDRVTNVKVTAFGELDLTSITVK
jgi:oligopeptide transport system substrate-binding protein